MKILLLFSFFSILTSCNYSSQKSTVKVAGQMRDVMWKGDLNGKISTDSLSQYTAYGLGPVEGLTGEVLLFEGKTFITNVIDSISLKVTLKESIKAPFFVYSKDSDLKEIPFPSRNLDLRSTEYLIDSLYDKHDRPLLIRIDGVFKELSVHSVNLPQGSSVSSPKEAHKGLTKYKFNNLKGTIVGFFSRKHKAIFTHHDSFLHAHFISDSHLIMGHLDSVAYDPQEVKLSVSK